TSAIEHFGLCVYGQQEYVENYDKQAMSWIYHLLKPNGLCYITVPYGKELRDDGHWRVYNKAAIQDRFIGKFLVEEKIFFKSGGCSCPDIKGIVAESDA